MDGSTTARVLEGILAEFGARATGWWRVEGDALVLVGFRAAGDMPDGVAEGFVEATRRVSLDQQLLSIVRVVSERRPVVAVASELPSDVGSGYWLRAFGAARSVAVPIEGDPGEVVGVLSVAVGEACVAADEAIAAKLRRWGSGTMDSDGSSLARRSD